jgi:hypothetical protein
VLTLLTAGCPKVNRPPSTLSNKPLVRKVPPDCYFELKFRLAYRFIDGVRPQIICAESFASGIHVPKSEQLSTEPSNEPMN